ncbi:hypothetical protein BKA56DRAFT_733835 [Ilyonectria sp. MPI-CAGE-AT-0026]|nr:hypothetical protein BKA56DRAFT_733835 [Ilyonectria sp. MPI-CAGE-AT-0026]
MNFAPFIDPEPGALVQRYSWEIDSIPRPETASAEFSQLHADIVYERNRRANEIKDEIQRISNISADRPEDEVTLFQTQHELSECMKSFQKLVPGSSTTNSLPTSWGEVEKAVQEVQAQWETRKKETHLGKAKSCLRRMCNGLSNHSAILKLIPSESVYTSLIAGSVTMIIKASANHINITEAFAQGIVVINDAVSIAQKSQVFNTTALQQLVMRLYSQVFTYLIKFMTWYTDRSRTRFLKSLNENIQLTFQSDLDRVKEISELLSRHIQFHMSADGRVSKLMLEETSGDMKYLVKLQESSQIQARLQTEATASLVENMVHSQFQKSREELREDMRSFANALHNVLRQEISGAAMTNLLMQQATLSSVHSRSGSDSSLTSDQAMASVVNLVSLNQRGADIQFQSRQYEEFFDWDQVHLFSESFEPIMADSTLVMRLKAFTETMESQIMYAHNRYQGTESNSLAKAISKYISLARETKVPVVSYFCRISSEEAPPNRTKESIELSALLYAMIRQVVNLLPTELDNNAPILDQTRLASLDGTLRTWDGAVSLFRDLVNAVRLPMLLIVIDGLVFLEDDFEHSTDGKMDKLILCLKELVDSSEAEDRILKVLFTTEGLSEPLCQELDESDIVACSPLSPGRVGRPPRSGQVVSF